MCYIAHQWFIWTTRNLSVRIYFYIAPRRSKNMTIIFFTFVTGMKYTFWCLLRPWLNNWSSILTSVFIVCEKFAGKARFKVPNKWLVKHLWSPIYISLHKQPCCAGCSQGRPSQCKIHQFSKIAVTFEPIQPLRCPSKFTIFNHFGVKAP